MSRRYIPPSGFAPGNWTFSLHLDLIDEATGVVTQVAALEKLPIIRVGP
ncbi:MAG: hypothetical protein ACR2OU_01895 [Thermomicrobiales bacterium]